jgi:hypothetical protein
MTSSSSGPSCVGLPSIEEGKDNSSAVTAAQVLFLERGDVLVGAAFLFLARGDVLVGGPFCVVPRRVVFAFVALSLRGCMASFSQCDYDNVALTSVLELFSLVPCNKTPTLLMNSLPRSTTLSVD